MPWDKFGLLQRPKHSGMAFALAFFGIYVVR